MIDDVLDLWWLQPKVYGYDNGAQLGYAEIELEEAMAVQREHGDAIASRDSKPGKCAGEAVDTLIHLLKGETGAATN